jgi:hypothetical protein
MAVILKRYSERGIDIEANAPAKRESLFRYGRLRTEEGPKHCTLDWTHELLELVVLGVDRLNKSLEEGQRWFRENARESGPNQRRIPASLTIPTGLLPAAFGTVGKRD